jgi:hypothetical protein
LVNLRYLHTPELSFGFSYCPSSRLAHSVILEDMLLKCRQFSPATEQFAAIDAKMLECPRQQNIEPASLGLPARVAVDESVALSMLSLDKGKPDAARKAFWRFRRINNIKTLPGGVYSVRAIERACK